MSDVNSSLPVRTQNNGDIVAKIGDATTPSQQLAVDASGRLTMKLDDGSGNAVTSQVSGAQRALDVGIDVAGVQVDPRQIRALTTGDAITASLAAGTNLIGAVNLDLGSAPISSTNPLPVSISTTTPGTAVQSYATSVGLASLASTTITYTVAASHTFNLERIWASASGKIKVVVSIGASTIFVAFNSTSNPNVDITVNTSPLIAAAGTVNVTITNLEALQQDVYATIEGNQN